MNQLLIKNALLMTARLIAGGALILAAFGKLKNPDALMLSIKSFELAPLAIIPLSAYLLPWLELIVGVCLIYGVATRASGAWAMVLYSIFTLALISVLVRGMEVDCGCFGALTGESSVSWRSIVRNGVFLSASAITVFFGGGTTALDQLFAQENVNPNSGQSGA
ncbi:MAG: MauE/DoxX family redox-associated membrane protein [Sumerlaeia bacterium]